jgi:hypothetical protein
MSPASKAMNRCDLDLCIPRTACFVLAPKLLQQSLRDMQSLGYDQTPDSVTEARWRMIMELSAALLSPAQLRRTTLGNTTAMSTTVGSSEVLDTGT